MKLRRMFADPPEDYYTRLAQIESNNNPLAKAKTSSAAGLYQFTKGTWSQLTGELGLDYSLEDRFDPTKSRKIVQEFTKRNEKYLKNKLGRDPNQAELYLAHFSGMGGARKLLDTVKTSPNKLVTDFVSPGALKANKNVFYNKDGTAKKAYEVYNWSAKKFNNETINPNEAQEEVKEPSVVHSKEDIRAREAQRDNTLVKNATYATLPDLDKEEGKEQVSIEKIKELLAKERQSTEDRFIQAFQQKQVEKPSYLPQQEDSSLYDYIDIDTYEDGGKKKEDCQCDCPGKPSCEDLEEQTIWLNNWYKNRKISDKHD